MKIFLCFCSLCAIYCGCVNAAGQERLEFTMDSLKVYAPIGIEPDSIGSDYAMECTPYLYDQRGDTLWLDPVIFRGNRNEKYVKRQRHFGDLPAADCKEYNANKVSVFYINESVARSVAPWAWDEQGVNLALKREKEGCCNIELMASLALGEAAWVIPFEPIWAEVPDFTGAAGELERDNPVLQHISQYRPYDDTRILRKEEGALYVHFPLDKWDLRRDFRDNAATLDQIVDITAQIMTDTASNVKIIQIIGLASVEGPVKRNQLLGQNRANALKDYIQARVATPDSLFEVVNGGEAWTELRDQINDLDFEGRDQLLSIIDNESDPDVRERKMRQLQGGKPYSYLRDNVLSDQRNSGYLRIYYDYVPDTNAAIINGASELLAAERWDEALAQLLPVKADPRSWNALGVALYMTGDKAQAMDYFHKAAASGNPQAAENLQQLD